jgi:hypothetical protein
LILPTRPQFAMILHLFKSMRASTTTEPTIGLFLLNEMTTNPSAQTLPQIQIVKCKGRIPHENEGFACSLSLCGCLLQARGGGAGSWGLRRGARCLAHHCRHVRLPLDAAQRTRASDARPLEPSRRHRHMFASPWSLLLLPECMVPPENAWHKDPKTKGYKKSQKPLL